MIGTTDSKWTHEGEEPASEGRVYREVSFNDRIRWFGASRVHKNPLRLAS
jgi:hypothetical protein